jgi:hypothetical protein
MGGRYRWDNRPVTFLRLAIALLLVWLAACSTGNFGLALVTFETPDGSRFVVQVDDPATVDRLRNALALDGRAGIPNGRLEPGDGGFNSGHEWHMVEVELVDIAIEVCDGTASMVDDDLDYWLNTVGRYCPWDARVVAIDE